VSALLVDVVDDPDGAFPCVVRVDQAPGECAPEKPPVLAAHEAFGFEDFTARQRGVGGTPQFAKFGAGRMKVGTADAFHVLWMQIAEDFRVAPVAAHDHALADEDDADIGAFSSVWCSRSRR
jgi:hypothetical protein